MSLGTKEKRKKKKNRTEQTEPLKKKEEEEEETRPNSQPREERKKKSQRSKVAAEYCLWVPYVCLIIILSLSYELWKQSYRNKVIVC